MPLPHFTNIESHHSNDEPIFKNLYETTVVLPSLIEGIHDGYQTILLENITSIGLPVYKELAPLTQKFKYSTRNFLGLPSDTSYGFSFSANLNQNQDYQVKAWRILKDWYDLGWNNQDGTLHYKRNLVGDVIIHLHDKEGHVVRRITYFNCQMKNITGFDGDLTWEGTEIFNVTCDMIADYWDDYYY
jgi:hypothetical protein